jgi:hypothetical protein
LETKIVISSNPTRLEVKLRSVVAWKTTKQCLEPSEPARCEQKTKKQWPWTALHFVDVTARPYSEKG